MESKIIHLDLDAFFIAVECKHNPKLLGKPLLIGGSSQRGVVAACSYEARRFGVQSGMAMKMARMLCPQAQVISGDMEAYTRNSHLVTEIIAHCAPLYEKASIDEFYVDASGMDRFFGAFKWALDLKKKILHESGLPISMALACNKLVSKVAAGEFKPNAEKEIPGGMERDFFAPLAIEKLPGVGKQTAKFLHGLGVKTVETLRNIPLKYLESALGKNGIILHQKSNAIDDRPVVAYSEQKSISTECTFQEDTIDMVMLDAALASMVESVAFQLREKKRLTSCVTVKIRYSNFDTETQQAGLPYTSSDHQILHIVRQLFKKLYHRRMLIRLIGVRLSGLVAGSHQIRLFEDTEESIRLYEAMDWIRHRYGSDKITRAKTIQIAADIRRNTNFFKG